MLIIGQRLNLAGNASLRKSIQAGRLDAICKEALLQEQAGVHAMDVHVSPVPGDRSRFMVEMINQIRLVSRLPLSIDDTDLDLVEAGLKRSGGDSFINSPVDVNQNADRICSLAAQFKDTQLLVVPLKSGKTPDEPNDFLKTSSSILAMLEDRGVSRKRVLMDAVLFCLKQARQKVLNTLDRIKILKEQVGVRSVIGLSNISYQLKNKETIHAQFLKLAKKAGLDSVICDPLEKTVMDAAKRNDSSPFLGREDFLKLVETLVGHI